MGEREHEIIVFPDFDKLKKEVEKLRIELSMLLSERDELRFVICKNIEAQYMLEFGALVYRAYELQCTALRLKRELELIRASKNRQERVNLSSIKQTLDFEFAEYQEKLNTQIAKMNDALAWSRAKKLPDADARELKRLYHAIVKALHPDLNPNVTEEQIRLLESAVIAYQNGDLDALRIIYEMIGGNAPKADDQSAVAQLLKTRERLLQAIKAVREEIRKIKSEYPYTLREFLDDEEKKAKKKAELEETIRHYTELIQMYRAKIEELLG